MESVAQGMIDYHVATAVLTGIMASTKGFTAPNTSAKSLTIAAQMMSGGAKQQDIVNTLFARPEARVENKPFVPAPKPEVKKTESKDSQSFSIMNPPKLEGAKDSNIKHQSSNVQSETIADKLAKQGVELTEQGVKDAKTGEVIKDEVDKKDSVEDEQSPKKFKNPSQKRK